MLVYYRPLARLELGNTDEPGPSRRRAVQRSRHRVGGGSDDRLIAYAGWRPPEGARAYAAESRFAAANRALVNVHPSGRWTALHQAALVGDCDTVRFLCERGADPSLRNRDGDTPRHVALSRGHVACGALIMARGGAA